MGNENARENLMRLASERGASLAGLSALIGRNASYLQQYIRKGSPKKLEEQDRRTLARFFAVDESLLGAPEDISFGTMTDFVSVPRLDASAAAGVGAEGSDTMIGHLGFAPGWLRAQGLEPQHCSAIAVRGDSMENTLFDGDEILVDTRRQRLRSGIHVVRVEDQLLVKRLQAEQPGTLISDNALYPPVDLLPEQVEIIGRVVWKAGRLR